MARVKRGKAHLKRRKTILKLAKGFKWGRKKTLKAAKIATVKAGAHRLRDLRVKKRTAKALWNVRINAALRPLELSYSKFKGALNKKEIELDRKVLSELAKDHEAVFEKLVQKVK